MKEVLLMCFNLYMKFFFISAISLCVITFLYNISAFIKKTKDTGEVVLDFFIMSTVIAISIFFLLRLF